MEGKRKHAETRDTTEMIGSRRCGVRPGNQRQAISGCKEGQQSQNESVFLHAFCAYLVRIDHDSRRDPFGSRARFCGHDAGDCAIRDIL
jgi:hypothetical protein